jgi:hypothetical protein
MAESQNNLTRNSSIARQRPVNMFARQPKHVCSIGYAHNNRVTVGSGVFYALHAEAI